MKLALLALAKTLCGFLIICLLLFLPAGTFMFIGAWRFVGVLFIPLIIMGVFMLVKAPDLLKKRLDTKESDKGQKAVVALSAIIFVCGFLMAGIDFRFALSHVSKLTVIVFSVIFLLGYAMYAVVISENEYLSRTVRVEKEQKVVETGLYAMVRHPMYLATVLMFLSIPMILGSWYSLLFFAFYPLIIVFRIAMEEKLLEKELVGYKEYKQKVKYRLIPFIW